MWTNQYTQTLTGNSLLGANFNYVVEIPAQTGDVYIRLGLRSPTTGQCRVQSMYIGHGSGYSFDGSQVQVTVGGNGNFTLSGGSLTYSDPILASSFGFDDTKKIYLAYGILNGDYYRRNDSAGTGYALHYKSGPVDAGTTSKSGYTTQSSRTALLEIIQASDAIPTEEPIEEETGMGDNTQQVLDGKRHSAGGDIAGQANKHLHLQLYNNVSGKKALLYELDITPTVDTVVSLRSYTTALANTFPKCNLFFGAGQGQMDAKYGHEDSVLGNFHSIHKLKGGVRNIIKLDCALVCMNSGTSVVVAFHQAGAGAVANMQWREI